MRFPRLPRWWRWLIGLGLLAAGAVFAPVWYVRLPFVPGLTALVVVSLWLEDTILGGE